MLSTPGIVVNFGHDGFNPYIFMREDEIGFMNQWMKENNCEIEIRFKNNKKPEEGIPHAQGSVSVEGTDRPDPPGPMVGNADRGMHAVSVLSLVAVRDGKIVVIASKPVERIIVSRLITEPEMMFMSRVDDPANFNYDPDDCDPNHIIVKE